jgi:periplasmic protein TonB
MDLCQALHLISKHTAMTNNEILKADLLDIIFEKRNKNYGAYALRRGYDQRLLIALGAAMSVILLFVLINILGGNDNSSASPGKDPRIVEITEINLAKEKPKEPEKPKEKIKPVEKTASEKFIDKIVVAPDKKVTELLTDVTDLKDKMISDSTTFGKKYTGIIPEGKDKTIGTGIETPPEKKQPDFIADEKDPEFPGGPEALQRFLGNNLTTPSELENGEKKTVRVRFKVDKDGSVNSFEIISSGGNEFDNEVLRVCKKMPHWKPAHQNGINVPVNYVLPVTFIGAEQ